MKNFIKEYGIYILILVIIILVKTFLVTTIRVNGTSMDPTLKDKDIMILNKIVYKTKEVKRFDIVVVKDESDIIKRVIALPNETIKYENNKLYINGQEIKDPYNKIEQYNFEYTLGDNEYFVMGDNRGVSKDSRMIGPVTKEQIMGKTTITIFPFDRWGNKE